MTRGNDYYQLEADPERNRIYFKLSGQAPSVAAIPNFEQDWKAIVAEVKPGFTILGDFLEAGDFLPDVEALNTKIQGWLMQNGCRKVAQLAPLSVIAQVNDLSKKSGLREILRGFNFMRSAEMWLDMK